MTARKFPAEAYLKEKRRIEEQNREKTERLRGLRLAKEAAERDAALALGLAPADAKRKKR